MDKIKPMEKAYLGDSVYAEFDGFGLILTIEFTGWPQFGQSE